MKYLLAMILVGLWGEVCSVDIAGQQIPREQFHVIMLAGQSNMAGRGALDEQAKVAHPRIVMLNKAGQWVPATDPMHFDKKSAGVGLAKTFAEAVVKENPDTYIGLVPTAAGGSSITRWEPGAYHKQTKSHPYDDAIARMQRALQDGVLKGVLWHQGESDGKAELAAAYHDRLVALVARLRTDLPGAAQVPFVIGQLGQFPKKPWGETRRQVDAAQQAVAQADPLVGWVPSDGLGCNKDQIHFDAAALREFGRRYAKVYMQMLAQ